jgi:hypothetical protein
VKAVSTAKRFTSRAQQSCGECEAGPSGNKDDGVEWEASAFGPIIDDDVALFGGEVVGMGTVEAIELSLGCRAGFLPARDEWMSTPWRFMGGVPPGDPSRA